MNKDTPLFTQKLEELLKALPDNSSLVVGLTILGEDDDPEFVTMDSLTAYKGEYCAEALVGLLMDQELIDKGIVDDALDHMAETLKERNEEEGSQDTTDASGGSTEGDSDTGVQDT